MASKNSIGEWLDGIAWERCPMWLPVTLLVLVPAMIGVGVSEFLGIREAELEGGTLRLNAVLMLLYKMGGKWTMLGLFLFASLVLGAAGFYILVRRQRARRARSAP